MERCPTLYYVHYRAYNLIDERWQPWCREQYGVVGRDWRLSGLMNMAPTAKFTVTG